MTRRGTTRQEPKPQSRPTLAPEPVEEEPAAVVVDGHRRARDAALADLHQARTLLAGWERQRDVARADVAALDAQSGEQVLDDPAAVDAIADDLHKAQGRLTTAEHAVLAAGARVTAAEASFLNAEAAVVEDAAVSARAVLVRHQERTEELRAQLREHEGEFVPGAGASRSGRLAYEVRVLELQEQVLRELAAGVDPAVWIAQRGSVIDSSVNGVPVADIYPSVVRADGVAWGRRHQVEAQTAIRLEQEVAARRAADEQAMGWCGMSTGAGSPLLGGHPSVRDHRRE